MMKTTKCPNCGQEITEEWMSKKDYCSNCGAKLAVENEKLVVVAAEETKQKPTKLWYLAPILFSVIGGVIGYMAVADRDKKMAMLLLVIGVVLTIIGVAAGLLILSNR